MNQHANLQRATLTQLRAVRRVMAMLLRSKRIEVSRSGYDVFTDTLNTATHELEMRSEYRTDSRSCLADAPELELTNIASRALHLATELSRRGYDEALENGLWQLYHDAKNELASRKTRAFSLDYLTTADDDTQAVEVAKDAS